MPYDHIALEKKWQKFWEENHTFRTENTTDKPKKYILDMFPYPSGAGLHVGHPKGYTATDIVSRYYHAKGHNVLHPMGFDAFGLPAENYAIKTGTHPAITTAENIATFTEQMKNLGFSYDWDRMVDTTDPEYYKWTQWIFLELFRRGLAYEQDLPINYCPSCKTGLANEEVLSDNTCDRCGTRVERRPIRQWVLKITEYADRLISDLDSLDWPEGIKEMQRNWIGKSEGCEFRMMKKMENKPLALLLHGWDDAEDRTIWHWMTPLKKDLESVGYEVIMEQLPGNNAPDLEKQLAFLEQYKDRLDERSVIIGHSMGGFLGMHFVERLDKKIGKLICVAPIFNGLVDHVNWSKEATGWDIGSASMRKNYNPEKIRKNVSDWHVFLSENDEYIIPTQAKKHFEAIGTPYTVVQNAGHFLESDNYARFDALSEYIVPNIRVYTTRVDTVYGMTYAVLAPDHPQVDEFITDEHRADCTKYIEEVKSKSDQDRTADNKEKTGVFTGSYVVNPYSGESVPLWIADYVLGHFGTGAVMAVPAHDDRDFEFAKKYDLPIKQSIRSKYVYVDEHKPRPGVETVTRHVVDVILENSRGEFLLLDEGNGVSVHFIGGGIEDGDTEAATIAKEVREETGYTEIEIVSPVGGTYLGSFGYRVPKGKNQESWGQFFHVRLLSENRVPSEVEEGRHTMTWYTKEEIESKITWKVHADAWKTFLQGIRPTPDDGYLVQSGLYDGLSSSEARKILTEKAEKEGFGKRKVNYKLRDWLFSRQRYWGEPIPLIHISHEDYASLPVFDNGVSNVYRVAKNGDAFVNKQNGIESLCIVREVSDLSYSYDTISEIYDGLYSKIIIDPTLPLTLPNVEKYEPAGDGQSPLATVPDWVNVRLADNLSGKRETNTMPQWGGSCWYYLRYMDPRNPDALAGKEALEYWGIVDEYVGGAEHAVLHLLYARFWHKVLFDAGVVPTREPFQKLTNVGMILAYAYERADGGLVAVDLVEERDGKYFEKQTGKEVKQVVAKMSKSLKNVINPNDIVREYGADTLRLYEMSMAAFTDTAPWNPDAIIGVRRFLDKAYATFVEGRNIAKDEMKAMKLLHKTVKKVGEDIVGYKFNTAITALMILQSEGLPTDPEWILEWKEKFAIMLHPFAPHMAEELWASIGKTESIYMADWPEYDDFMLVDDEVTIAVQVNGKLRGTLTCLNGVMQEEVSSLAHENPDIMKWIEGKTLVKEIYIPNKMLSIVVKE